MTLKNPHPIHLMSSCKTPHFTKESGLGLLFFIHRFLEKQITIKFLLQVYSTLLFASGILHIGLTAVFNGLNPARNSSSIKVTISLASTWYRKITTKVKKAHSQYVSYCWKLIWRLNHTTTKALPIKRVIKKVHLKVQIADVIFYLAQQR